MENRISELRKGIQMTQQELADVVEVSRQTIHAIEKGKYNPSVLLAHKLALVFSLAIEDVFLFGEE